MRRSRVSIAFAALLLCASVIAPVRAQDSTSSEDEEYADEEKAFLIVRKAPLEDDVVVGSNLTVVIDIHNAGSRCDQPAGCLHKSGLLSMQGSGCLCADISPGALDACQRRGSGSGTCSASGHFASQEVKNAKSTAMRCRPGHEGHVLLFYITASASMRSTASQQGMLSVTDRILC